MFVPNETPWADRTISKAWDKLAEVAHRDAMPRRVPGETAKFREYGAGHYGVVMPTSREGVVLKLTTDETEAGFVSLILGNPELRHARLDGLVRYYSLVKLSDVTHKRRGVYAIWREEAFDVGFALHMGWGKSPRWERDLLAFKDFASVVKDYIKPGKSGWAVRREKVRNMLPWGSRVASYGDREVPKHWRNPEKSAIAVQLATWKTHELSSTPDIYLVGETLWDLTEVGVLLADVHLNNIGKVQREDYRDGVVVITDPGHMVLLDPDLEIPLIPEI